MLRNPNLSASVACVLLSLSACNGIPAGGSTQADCSWEDVDGVFTLVCTHSEGGGGAGTGGGATGGAGGVDVPPPANDSCAAPTFIDVAPGDHAFEHGTMAGAQDDTRSFCVDQADNAGLPDVVYQITLSDECALRVTLDGATGFNGALSFRSQACDTDEYCTDTAGTQEVFQQSVASGTYWLIVTAHPGDVDDFTLSVQCNPPACGDGFLAVSGEACDDGNLVDGDGCDATCALEAADASVDTCDGAVAGPGIAISVGDVLHVPGDGSFETTLGATDSGTGSCSLQPDGDSIFAAPDHVYRVVPSASGTLTATIGLGPDDVAMCGAAESLEPDYPYPYGCYDRALHVREGVCNDVGAEVACSDNPSAWWSREEVSFAVTAGQDYFVFVDGWNDDEFGVGPYVLRLELE